MSFGGLFARLLIDIKILVAKCDEDIFYALYRHDEEFAKYARSIAGINDFIKLAKKEERDEYIIETKIFGRLHSFNDEPAVIGINMNINMYKLWFYYGKIWRDNDKPTRVDNRTLMWHDEDGRFHRIDKPAVIGIDSGYSAYFIHGILQ